MSGKLLDVGHNDALASLESSTADTASVGDMHAGHCTLERAQAQLALTLQVEAGPEPGKAFCQCCTDIGQYAHLFTFALHEGIELSCQLVVDLLFVLHLPAKVRNIFEFFPKGKKKR